MSDGSKKKIKKVRRTAGAPAPASRPPEAAIPVVVEDYSDETTGEAPVAVPEDSEEAPAAGEETAESGTAPPAPGKTDAAADDEAGGGAEVSVPEGEGPAEAAPGVAGAPEAEESPPSTDEAAPAPAGPAGAGTEAGAEAGTEAGAEAGTEAGADEPAAADPSGAAADGAAEPARREHTEEPAAGVEEPASDEKWEVEPAGDEAGPAPEPDEAGPSGEAGGEAPDGGGALPAAEDPTAPEAGVPPPAGPLEDEEEPAPRLAVEADDELLRLKAEFSRKSFQIDMEKERLQDMGNQLAARGEDLENQIRAIAEKDAAIRHQEGELVKRSELVNASSEAISALEEEVRARQLKVRDSEEGVMRRRAEFDALQAELAAREQKLAGEMSETEEQRKKVERLLSDIYSREASLKQGESESARKLEELARVKKEAEEIDSRLKAQETRLKRREDEVKALEQHLLSIEEEIRLCPHCGAVEEFHQLARRTEELRSRGEETDELNIEIKAARKALREGFYDTSTEHARRAAELLKQKEHEGMRREVVAKIMAAEGLAKMLRDAKAEVSSIQNAVSEAWSAFKTDQLPKAEALAERARREAVSLEQERFQALDALVESNSQLSALKKSGVNVLAAEKRREEAEKAMASGDFRRARVLATETVVMASEAAQSQDVATAMSQIKLAEETLEELRALGLDSSEWERTVNRSREFLKKLDFKSAEETARWVRQKAREAGRMYRQALLTIDHGHSVITTYKDMGLIARKAEELHDEAKTKLKEGDPELALNLAKKAEKMVKEISERHKGAQAALRKAQNLIRTERRSGKDVTRSEKLFDLAQHQQELGEYANAMKLANKAVEALSTMSTAALELCPTCGEAIPENAPECPNCAERNSRKEKEQAPATPELARRTRLGAKGGRKYACPYCGDLFEITVPSRPITITCPWCSNDVSVVE